MIKHSKIDSIIKQIKEVYEELSIEDTHYGGEHFIYSKRYLYEAIDNLETIKEYTYDYEKDKVSWVADDLENDTHEIYDDVVIIMEIPVDCIKINR